MNVKIYCENCIVVVLSIKKKLGFWWGNPRMQLVSASAFPWVHISDNSKSDTKHLGDVS